MIILSFVAIPLPGQIIGLLRDLRAIDSCEVIPAGASRDVAIVLAEVEGTAEQEALMDRFSAVPSLESIALTFASMPDSSGQQTERLQ